METPFDFVPGLVASSAAGKRLLWSEGTESVLKCVSCTRAMWALCLCSSCKSRECFSGVFRPMRVHGYKVDSCLGWDSQRPSALYSFVSRELQQNVSMCVVRLRVAKSVWSVSNGYVSPWVL